MADPAALKPLWEERRPIQRGIERRSGSRRSKNDLQLTKKDFCRRYMSRLHRGRRHRSRLHKTNQNQRKLGAELVRKLTSRSVSHARAAFEAGTFPKVPDGTTGRLSGRVAGESTESGASSTGERVCESRGRSAEVSTSSKRSAYQPQRRFLRGMKKHRRRERRRCPRTSRLPSRSCRKKARRRQSK